MTHVYVTKKVYVNNQHWMISFADLISLVLTFFVMIYSMTDPLEVNNPREVYNSKINFKDESKNIEIKLASEQDNLSNEYVMGIIQNKIVNDDGMKKFTVKTIDDKLTISIIKENWNATALQGLYDTIKPLTSNINIHTAKLTNARDVAYEFQKLGMSGNISYFEENSLQNYIEIVIYPKFN